MIPTEFANYFLGSVGASAALIGLLFVAISIAPEQTVMSSAPLDRQAVAAGTFVALINAFFISLAALLPGANLGWTTLFTSAISIFNSLSQGWFLLSGRITRPRLLRRTFMIAVSLVLYGFELYYAISLLITPTQVSSVLSLSTILLGIYGVALVRAWELLGARRYGLFSWLNPVRDTDSRETALNSERADEQTKAARDR